MSATSTAIFRHAAMVVMFRRRWQGWHESFALGSTVRREPFSGAKIRVGRAKCPSSRADRRRDMLTLSRWKWRRRPPAMAKMPCQVGAG